MSGRRRVLAGLAAVALAPTAARAQQSKPARVVVLSRSPVPELPAFREGMRELGWVEGRTVAIEERTADGGDNARLRAVASAVAAATPDVIWAAHSEAALQAKQASPTIPIVFTVGDPLLTGLVASLARPGGNATGLAYGEEGLIAKRAELLNDAFPQFRRFAYLYNDSTLNRAQVDDARATAARRGLEIIPALVTESAGFAPAIEAAVGAGAQGLLMNWTPYFSGNAATIASLASRHRLPAIYNDAWIVEAGGLMSFGPDRRRIARRVASYVDRILKGAKPGDLPVERWDRFELVINLRTAAALGHTIPAPLIALADRVIE